MTRHIWLSLAIFTACSTASTATPPTTTTSTSTSTSTSTTTTTSTPSTTAPPKPVVEVPGVRPQSAAAAGLGTDGDIWAALARCETGMRNLRNHPYSGFFQFLPATWRSLGLSGMPADHSYEEQRAAAQRLVARSGWGQFPGCARKLGLR